MPIKGTFILKQGANKALPLQTVVECFTTTKLLKRLALHSRLLEIKVSALEQLRESSSHPTQGAGAAPQGLPPPSDRFGLPALLVLTSGPENTGHCILWSGLAVDKATKSTHLPGTPDPEADIKIDIRTIKKTTNNNKNSLKSEKK